MGKSKYVSGYGSCLQRVVPPLAVVANQKPHASMTERSSLPVARFGGRDLSGSVVGDRIHQVVVTAHRDQLPGGQLIEREIDGASPAVARSRGHVTSFEHVGPFDVRIVPRLGEAVLRLFRPAYEAIHGALGAVTIPDEQAEAQRRSPLAHSLERDAQSSRPDDAVRLVAVHRLAGEVVPGGVLGIPPDSGDELVDEDEVLPHRRFPCNVSDTSRSITSARGKPAAAIIRG